MQGDRNQCRIKAVVVHFELVHVSPLQIIHAPEKHSGQVVIDVCLRILADLRVLPNTNKNGFCVQQEYQRKAESAD